MSLRLYFAYGSNLDADQMRVRCPGSRARFRGRLRHHRLDFTWYSTRWNGGAADVLPHSEGDVWGVVYELPDSDLMRLDRFEGGYDRVHLEVLDDDGALHRTTSYAVRSKGSFSPHQDYVAKMLHWGAHWKLPATYLERLHLYRRG